MTDSSARALCDLPQWPGPGSRVALLCGNTADAIATRDATILSRSILVPLNPKLTAPEITYVLRHARPALILVAAELTGVLRSALEKLERTLAHHVFPAGVHPAVIEIDGHDAPHDHRVGATLIYTSGTTGLPKGCMRSERRESARADELIASYGIHQGDRQLIACPLAHSAPGILLRATRRARASTNILPAFDAESFLQAVARYRSTIFFLVPTQYQRILALPSHVRQRYSVDSVRVALIAGAPASMGLKRRIIEWLGDGRLWEFYGSSETGTVTVLPPAQHLVKPGSVGLPAEGVNVEIRDDHGKCLEPGQTGEIFVESDSVMDGYWDPEYGQTQPNEDRFISVGDLGYRDRDGYLYLVDRKHDTIISGGVNVYPAQVEAALLDHPHIVGAIVFGIDDDEWGQMVVAVVALAAEGCANSNDLRDYLRPVLASPNIPKAFVFDSPRALPIGASGKPLRRRAREKYGDRLRALTRHD